jgi:hypothetical protein
MAGKSIDSQPPKDATAQILEWYARLYSRRVDLVGDFAGSERFLVHGESLLLQCFSDKNLDFESGFQLLHASYAVEKFLQGLVSRRCNFHIAFFDDYQDVCVPQHASPANSEKYLLARAAIIRHLQVNLQNVHKDIEVHRFASSTNDDFAEYLRTTDIYFVLCHDGASIADLKNDQSDESDRRKAYKKTFRTLIYDLMQRGFSTALVNGLEWQDTKVITTVLEHSRSMDITIPPPVSFCLYLKLCRDFRLDLKADILS